MDDRVLAAADNNARWCDLVCRAHGVRTTWDTTHWVASRRAPDLYPDVVTLRPGVTAEQALRSADDRQGCSAKDSFLDLDLAGLGFVELFEASWIYRDVAPPRAGRSNAQAWTVVGDDGLAEWARAAGAPATDRRELVRDPSVLFLALSGEDGLRGGAIANRTGPVVGVSNVFAKTIAEDELWVTLAEAIAAAFPGLPLVGYEHGDDLDAACGSGFERIGPLRVLVQQAE